MQSWWLYCFLILLTSILQVIRVLCQSINSNSQGHERQPTAKGNSYVGHLDFMTNGRLFFFIAWPDVDSIDRLFPNSTRVQSIVQIQYGTVIGCLCVNLTYAYASRTYFSIDRSRDFVVGRIGPRKPFNPNVFWFNVMP